MEEFGNQYDYMKDEEDSDGIIDNFSKRNDSPTTTKTNPEAEQLIKQIEKEFLTLKKSLRSLQTSLELDRNQQYQRDEITKKIMISLKMLKKKLRNFKTSFCSSQEDDDGKFKEIFKQFYFEFEEKKKKYNKLKDQNKRTELITYTEEIEIHNNEKELEDRTRIFKDSSYSSSRKKRREPFQSESEEEDDDDDDFDEYLSNEEVSNKLFSEVFEIQDENIALVEQLLKKSDKIQEEATYINTTLTLQNEQLKHGILDTIQIRLREEIRMARKEIGSFMRGVAADKVLIVLCFFCVCVIMWVVILFVVCRCYVCTLICNSLGDEAIKKCKKIPLMYLD